MMPKKGMRNKTRLCFEEFNAQSKLCTGKANPLCDSKKYRSKDLCPTFPAFKAILVKETWIIRPRTALDDKYDALRLNLDDGSNKVLMISIIAFGVLGMLIIFVFIKFCKKKLNEAPTRPKIFVMVEKGEGGNGQTIVPSKPVKDTN